MTWDCIHNFKHPPSNSNKIAFTCIFYNPHGKHIFQQHRTSSNDLFNHPKTTGNLQKVQIGIVYALITKDLKIHCKASSDGDINTHEAHTITKHT